MSEPLVVIVTEEQMAKVFDFWLLRYREDPEGFTAEFGAVGEYGAVCAAYFVQLAKEIL